MAAAQQRRAGRCPGRRHARQPHPRHAPRLGRRLQGAGVRLPLWRQRWPQHGRAQRRHTLWPVRRRAPRPRPPAGEPAADERHQLRPAPRACRARARLGGWRSRARLQRRHAGAAAHQEPVPRATREFARQAGQPLLALRPADRVGDREHQPAHAQRLGRAGVGRARHRQPGDLGGRQHPLRPHRIGVAARAARHAGRCVRRLRAHARGAAVRALRGAQGCAQRALRQRAGQRPRRGLRHGAAQCLRRVRASGCAGGGRAGRRGRGGGHRRRLRLARRQRR